MYHFDKQIQYQNDEEYKAQFLSLFGLEKYDDDTKFMAMEKWTGWHASIVMQKIMDGTIKPGARPIEKALTGKDFYNEIIKRNYNIKIEEIKLKD